MINTETVNESALKNLEFAFEAGLRVPRLAYLNMIKPEEAEKIISNPGWLIPDDGVIAVEAVGVPISIIDLWDGDKFTQSTLCIDSPSLITGGQGMLLDANAITVFKNRDGVGFKSMKKIAKFLRQNEAEPSYIKLDIRLDCDEEYFNCIKFGLPDDVVNILEFFYNAKSEDELPRSVDTIGNFAASLRLWAYPYNPDVNKKVVDLLDFPDTIIGEIDECYCVMGSGRRVQEAWDNVYHSIPKIALRSGVCFKTDGGKEAKDIYSKLKQHGYICKQRSR